MSGETSLLGLYWAFEGTDGGLYIYIHIPLWSENVIVPKVNISALEINESSALEHKTKYILPETRE